MDKPDKIKNIVTDDSIPYKEVPDGYAPPCSEEEEKLMLEKLTKKLEEQGLILS